MSVILDTNQLPQDGDPDALSLQILKGVASEHGLRLAAPELVVEEWVAKVMRDVKSAVHSARKEARALQRFGAVLEIPSLDATSIAEDRRTRLVENVDVIDMPHSCWEEALRREVHRLPPTRDGSGARDAAIWAAVLAHARSKDEPTYFVSGNIKDFGSLEDPNQLHADLAAELGEPPVLQFDKSIHNLLSRLADRIENPWSVEELAAVGAAKNAIAGALERGILDELDAGDRSFGAGRYIAGPVVIEPTRITEQHAFCVEGKPVALVAVVYRVQASIGTLKRQGSRMSQLLADVDFAIPVRLWLRGDRTAADAELVSAWSPETVAFG